MCIGVYVCVSGELRSRRQLLRKCNTTTTPLPKNCTKILRYLLILLQLLCCSWVIQQSISFISLHLSGRWVSNSHTEVFAIVFYRVCSSMRCYIPLKNIIKQYLLDAFATLNHKFPITGAITSLYFARNHFRIAELIFINFEIEEIYYSLSPCYNFC
jgi:hypothetical protein